MFFQSLKKEILFFALGLTIITIVATTAISASSTKTAGEDAANVTGAVLLDQGEELLIQISVAAAERQDLLFEHIENETIHLASYVEEIYGNPSFFDRSGYWQFDKRVRKENDLYVNSETDISTFHIPSFVSLDSREKKNIELTANLDFIAPGILEQNPDIAAFYAIDTHGVTRYFPNIVLGRLAPPDYDPREDIYYKPATPDENPEKNVIWSPLYDDVAGRGLMITATAPVYTEDGFQGIVGTDVLLANIIESISAYSPIEGSYAFLIDKEGNAIAFPEQAYADFLGLSRGESVALTHLADNALPEGFLDILQNMMDGLEGFGSIHNGTQALFIAYAPLRQTEFSLAVVVEESTMLKAIRALDAEISGTAENAIVFRILPASVLIILFASIVSVFLVTRITRPIQELTQGAREIGRGNLDYKLNIKSKNEIGQLVASFDQMSSDLKKSREELYEYSQGLEVKIKERTKELEEANEHLEELDERKSEFVSLASHQLRTPLSAIKGYSSMLLEGSYGALTDIQTETVSKVFESCNRLVRIVEEFLDISRIENDKMIYEFESINIDELAASVADEMRELARKKGLELIYENDGKDAYFATADKGKMRQILGNLIDNAIKYTARGEVRVKLSRDDARHVILITVSDTGIGISDEIKGRLFDKFTRGEDAGKVIADGSGLGLYIVKKIMEKHHGRVWAESGGKGKGSQFHVELMSE